MPTCGLCCRFVSIGEMVMSPVLLSMSGEIADRRAWYDATVLADGGKCDVQCCGSCTLSSRDVPGCLSKSLVPA